MYVLEAHFPCTPGYSVEDSRVSQRALFVPIMLTTRITDGQPSLYNASNIVLESVLRVREHEPEKTSS